jgi:hypothetical protein
MRMNIQYSNRTISRNYSHWSCRREHWLDHGSFGCRSRHQCDDCVGHDPQTHSHFFLL